MISNTRASFSAQRVSHLSLLRLIKRPMGVFCHESGELGVLFKTVYNILKPLYIKVLK